MAVRRCSPLRWSLIAACIAMGTAGFSENRAAWSSTRSGPYRPCPERGEPCRILPLGDSITWGIGYDGGYRVALFERARADARWITFSGSQKNGPAFIGGGRFPRNNEGRSGWTIAQIATTVPRPALRDAPHIVLLHAGTNDVYRHANSSAMVAGVEHLLDQIERSAPRALIVVAEILPLTDPALRTAAEDYNSALRAHVQRRQAQGEHVMIVDQFSGFSTQLLSDGVHPTQAGYERMAAVWYAAIAPYLR